MPFFCLLLKSWDGIHAAGLRQLKKETDDKKGGNDVNEENATVEWEGVAPDKWEEETVQWGNLSLDDMYAPSATPTIAPTDIPTQAQTLKRVSETPSQAETLSPANDTTLMDSLPTEKPSTISAFYETFSGGDPSGKSFRIEIEFDDTPQQNAWHLFEGLGSSRTEIYAKDFGTILTGGLQITTFHNMKIGGYTFVIADINADGIGKGKIAIYDGDDTQLWENVGDFEFLIEKPFLIQ